MQNDDEQDNLAVKITEADFQAVRDRALPVLAVVTYGYGKPEDDRGMVAVWVEVDGDDPALADLYRTIQRAMREDEAFMMEHTVVADFTKPITLDDTLPVYWDMTFKNDDRSEAGRFSFPFLLPYHATEIAAIAEEGQVTICPLPKDSRLAQHLREKRDTVMAEALAAGNPDPGFPVPLHFHFPPDQETYLMVEGFTVDVIQPAALEECILMYYHLAGLDIMDMGPDCTGQSWEEILKNGDVHFSEAR